MPTKSPELKAVATTLARLLRRGLPVSPSAVDPVLLGRGVLVVATRHSVLVWEHRYYSAYWLPERDVDTASLPEGAVRRSPDERLRGLVHLDWDALDEWFDDPTAWVIASPCQGRCR